MSAFRLRVGVVLLLLWLLPFWLLAPQIAKAINPGDVQLAAEITTAILVVQTILGLAGMYVAGTEVKQLVKTTPKKQLLRVIWRILWSGKI